MLTFIRRVQFDGSLDSKLLACSMRRWIEARMKFLSHRLGRLPLMAKTGWVNKSSRRRKVSRSPSFGHHLNRHTMIASFKPVRIKLFLTAIGDTTNKLLLSPCEPFIV
jgi:hypothetical protein